MSRLAAAAGALVLFAATCNAQECPGGTRVGGCAHLPCDGARGPTTCEGGSCLCQPGYCRFPTHMVHVEFRRCRALMPGTSCGVFSPCTRGGMMWSSCVSGVCMCRSHMHLGADGACHAGWTEKGQELSEVELKAMNATQRAQALAAHSDLDTSDEDREVAQNVAKVVALACLPLLLLSGTVAFLGRKWRRTTSTEHAGIDYKEMPDGEVAAAALLVA